jgi:hypothetical protein
MQRDLTFGPWSFRVEAPVFSPLFAAFENGGESPWDVSVRSVRDSGPIVNQVSMQSHAGSVVELSGPAFVARLRPEQRQAEIDVDAGMEEFGLVAGLGGIVSWFAPRHDMAVLHAGAVGVGQGAAMLLAPPRGGKSTAVRESGARALSFNGLLVGPGATAWPLPFTGRDDPPLGAAQPRRITWGVLLRMGPEAGHRMLRLTEATHALLRSVVVVRGDPESARSVGAAIAVASRLRWISVSKPLGFDVASLLDSVQRSQ